MDTANFKITPLATGKIENACVKLYHDGKLIDTIATPTKVVKQTITKISATIAILAPIIGPLFDERIGSTLMALIPFYELMGGIEGFFLGISSILGALTVVFYYLKKSKKAEPIHSEFEALDKILKQIYK